MAQFEVFFDYYGSDTDPIQVHPYAVALMQEAGLIATSWLKWLGRVWKATILVYGHPLCRCTRGVPDFFGEEERTSIVPSMILLLK